MTTGTDVKLSKLESLNPDRSGPVIRTGYWTKGILRADVKIGHTVILARYERCGHKDGEPDVVKSMGSYVSSPVVALTRSLSNGNVVITTQNSDWLMEPNL